MRMDTSVNWALIIFFWTRLSGVGFAAGWSRQCFYCLVSRRMCLTSGLCGECRGNYIEVSSRCVKGGSTGRICDNLYLLVSVALENVCPCCC